ncbi:hypothetical protein B0H14DRAFT_2617212 [Mycena olivaceomarginata]|nr:hypothetical protein B0H14DRAFT_2617212 [Mycena olivaceomarginata]
MIQNTVYSVLLGDTVPLKLHGMTDDTLYTHYSSLSTVQANWGLKSLGRGDTIAALSNVLSFIAAKTGYKNVQIVLGDVPQFNLTGVASAVLTSTALTPFAAPNLKARGAGCGAVLTRPGLNTRLTSGSLPPPVNLGLQNKAMPWQMSARMMSGKAIIPVAGLAACRPYLLYVITADVPHPNPNNTDHGGRLGFSPQWLDIHCAFHSPDHHPLQFIYIPIRRSSG